MPALKAFQNVSNNKIYSYITSLGLTPEMEGGYVHEAHALGAFNGTNPLEMAASYATFANGGFPEDGFFFANRNELVGQFSNGKTAVANNAQITQGIADAVYPAVYNAIVAGMGNTGNGGNTLKIEGDPRGMFKVFVDEWNAEARRTQRNPVVIYNE